MSDVAQNMRRHLLPIYVLGVDNHKIQEPISRPNGYPSYQLSVCLDGNGIYIDENHIKHKIEKGDMFFFSSNTPHKYSAVSEPWKLPYIVFTGHEAHNIIEYLGFNKSMVIKGMSVHDFDKIVSTFTKIQDTFFSNVDSKTERVSAMLYSMLVFISEIYNKNPIRILTDVMKQITPAIDYINRNISRDISVGDLAKVLGISSGRVSVLFKQAFNMTPVQVIRKFKMECARRNLTTRPNMKMKDLIDIIGFTSVSYFVTVFKKEYGISPTEYKNSISNEDDWW